MSSAESFDVPGGFRFRKHEHESAHVCVVLEGGFLERDKRYWRDVGPGTVRVSGAARHDIDFSVSGATCLVMEVDSDVVSPQTAARFIENDSRLIELARSLARYSRKRDTLGAVRRSDLTTEFLAQIDRRLRGLSSPPPPWLERIRELLHDTGGAASVADLAREAGVHRVHVARTFRDHYGVPVTTYARRIRIQGALTLLAHNGMSLSQLAYQSGFADQSHLTREMRTLTGATPGAIRSRLHPFKT